MYSSTIMMYSLTIMLYTLSCTTAKMRHVSFVASKITVRNGVLDVVNHRFFTTKVRPDNALTMNDISNADAADNTAKTTIENDDAIARQKKRAIQYWNDSKSKHIEAMKDEIHDDVMQHLKEGKVLPIFHTLCRPPNERLFLTEVCVRVKDRTSDAIQLSIAPVTIGECVKDAHNIGDVDIGREMPYLPAFFNEDGSGRFYVEDIDFLWKFDKDYTDIVTALVNTPADIVGEDIEVTELKKPLNVDIKMAVI